VKAEELGSHPGERTCGVRYIDKGEDWRVGAGEAFGLHFAKLVKYIAVKHLY
jgi:hypothetical protein